MTTSTKQYRICTGSVYEYSEEQDAYIFIGQLMGRTLKEFLYDLACSEK